MENGVKTIEMVAWLSNWLEEELRAEREAIGIELERRHDDMLTERLYKNPVWLEFSRGPNGNSGKADASPKQPMKEVKEKPSESEKSKAKRTGQEEQFMELMEDETDPVREISPNRTAERVEDELKGFSSSHQKSPEKVMNHHVSDVFDDEGLISDEIAFVARLVTSPKFEISFAIFIVLNTVVMALESQYNGFEIGRALQYPRYVSTPEETWPGMRTFFDVLDYGFGVLFTVEVLLKIIGLKIVFLYDWWNWFDSVIVLGWLVDALGRDLVSFPIDPMMLRLARLARLLRLLRLVKSLQGFDPLYLMVTTLKGSLAVVFWVFVLIFVCQTMFALLLNQILASYFLETADADPKVKTEVFAYFGTFARAMLSMFEITLGNWTPVARLLCDGVSEWFMLFSLLHKVTMGFSVIAVINGIFIQETFKVAGCDDTIMLLQEQRAEDVLHKKMSGLFEAADSSGDGGVDLSEFRIIMAKPHVRTWLAAQQLDVHDADKLFAMLDKSKGGDEVTAADFVKGVTQLKGNARSVDLMIGLRSQQNLEEDMVQVRRSLSCIERQLCQHPVSGTCPAKPDAYAVVKPNREGTLREGTLCTTTSLLGIPEERHVMSAAI